MKLWKKTFLRNILFALIFMCFLINIQDILRYKGEYEESLADRYDSYRTQVASGMDIDVLYMGSSPVFASVAPMIIWEDNGYTGMNLGTSMQNAMSLYYSLLEVLEFTQPKVITLDFRDLCESRMPNDTTFYYSYRKTIDTLQSPGIKWRLLVDTAKSTGSLEHIFTITRFHTRWDSLTKKDFVEPESWYLPFTKGALMNDKHLNVTLVGTYDENTTPKEYSELSLSYYEKIVNLCRDRGIQILAVVPPTSELEEHMAEYVAINRFCEANGIHCLNYNHPELQQQLGLDFSTDYYDPAHLNISGSLKLSRHLSAQLEQLCDLPDHREDPAYTSWNEDLTLFRTKFSLQE